MSLVAYPSPEEAIGKKKKEAGRWRRHGGCFPKETPFLDAYTVM